MSHERTIDLAERARAAAKGDKVAAHAILEAVQDDVYGLALRMLGHPADAEDAAQEILVVVLTHLGSFRGESAFRTWVWRIAANHLARVRRGRRETITFETLDERLRTGLREVSQRPDPEEQALAREVRLRCTQAMLLSLDRELRIAYVLGDIFNLSGEEAAEVLEIDPATYRKRLSRARVRLHDFLRGWCGVFDWTDLAAIPESYATAWTFLRHNLETASGQTIVIRGGTSALGQAAINIARDLDARVLATTRSRDKTRILEELGAEPLIESADLSREVRRRVPAGVDGVIDIIGTSTLLDSLKMARYRGRVAMAGFLGGGAHSRSIPCRSCRVACTSASSPAHSSLAAPIFRSPRSRSAISSRVPNAEPTGPHPPTFSISIRSSKRTDSWSRATRVERSSFGHRRCELRGR